MQVYELTKDGNLVDIFECQKCQITGDYLYPSNYTEIKPLELNDFEIQTFNGTEWIKKQIDTGKTIYLKSTGQEFICQTENIADDYTFLKPLTQWDDFDGSKWATNIEKLRTHKINEINQAYNQYILSLYPIEKQLKMTMEYNALLNIQINETLTTEQADRKIELEDLHRWYKGMLVNHETDKQYILSEADIEKLKLFKATLNNE